LSQNICHIAEVARHLLLVGVEEFAAVAIVIVHTPVLAEQVFTQVQQH
jgi:hypothetical protein